MEFISLISVKDLTNANAFKPEVTVPVSIFADAELVAA